MNDLKDVHCQCQRVRAPKLEQWSLLKLRPLGSQGFNFESSRRFNTTLHDSLQVWRVGGGEGGGPSEPASGFRRTAHTSVIDVQMGGVYRWEGHAGRLARDLTCSLRWCDRRFDTRSAHFFVSSLQGRPQGNQRKQCFGNPTSCRTVWF